MAAPAAEPAYAYDEDELVDADSYESDYDGADTADLDWHIGGVPEWDQDPEMWESRSDAYRRDYEDEWQHFEDR